MYFRKLLKIEMKSIPTVHNIHFRRLNFYH